MKIRFGARYQFNDRDSAADLWVRKGNTLPGGLNNVLLLSNQEGSRFAVLTNEDLPHKDTYVALGGKSEQLLDSAEDIKFLAPDRAQEYDDALALRDLFVTVPDAALNALVKGVTGFKRHLKQSVFAAMNSLPELER